MLRHSFVVLRPCSFYPSTSSTSRVHADSSSKVIPALWSQNYDTPEVLDRKAVRKGS